MRNKLSMFSALYAAAALVSMSGANAQSVRGFDGFYAGAHAGYGKLEDTDGVDVDGAIGGIHAGYNYVSGSLLLGAEADFDWSGVEFSESDALGWAKGEMKYFASLRGRLGWTNGSTLVYATAGYSWSEFEASFSVAGLGSGKDTTSLDGAVAGGGIEQLFSDRVSARLEGLHYWQDGSGDVDVDTNVIRAGLTYHFR